MNDAATPRIAAQRGRFLLAGAVATLACAFSGIALSLAGLYEWAPTWPALAALLLLGGGLLAERAQRPRLAIALSVPVIALGGFVLAVALSGTRESLGEHLDSITALPSNSAAGLLAAALALALGARAPRQGMQLFCALLAALAVTMGTFGLLGRLLGIAPGIGWGAVSSVSILAGSGLVVCGSALLLQRALGRDGDAGTRGSLLPALVVLAIALGATAMAWRVSAEAEAAAQRQRFEHQSQQLAAAIAARLRGYFDLLHGAQGLFAASDSVEADEWRRYWDQIDLGARYPGVVGVGYAERLDARQRSDFEGAMAAQLRPGFRIWPEGTRDTYYPVTFLEPQQGANLRLAGFDLGSDAQRGAALARALARDEVALSGRVDVAGAVAGEVEPGFAVYVPLRVGKRDEDPPSRTLGVAYFEFRAREWMQPIGAEQRSGLQIRLFDGAQEDAAQLLYADANGAATGGLVHSQTLDLAGRQWRLVTRATPAFLRANASKAPLSVLLVGLFCSLLLFAIAGLLAGLRARAERLAAQRTAELARSQRAFQALTDTANDSIIAADADGRVRYVNPAAERCFGYAASELRQLPLTVLIPERYRAAHTEGMARFLAGGEPHVIGTTVELAGLRRDGSEFPLEISIAHWLSDGEHHFTAILRDITRRRDAAKAMQAQRKELERSNADLEQFAYVASHDLQEPLRMVASYVQLLARRYKGKLDTDADDFIGFAVDGAMRMQRLIDDLLAYSRIGSRADHEREVSATDCLEAALRNLAARIQETSADVRFGALPVVRIDPLQLTQVLQNLIGNALKFCGAERPQISVDAQREGECWHFRVSDNGIGIDPQYAERIFVIFQRLHTRQQYVGTGIGLSICKKIVERAGGRIWVESQPGKGATFHFTLPVLETDA